MSQCRSAQMKRSIVSGKDSGMFGGDITPIWDIYEDLTPRQSKIFRDDVHLIGSVLEGASLAGKECYHQFQKERWDCSSIPQEFHALGLMKESRKYPCQARTQEI